MDEAVGDERVGDGLEELLEGVDLVEGDCLFFIGGGGG